METKIRYEDYHNNLVEEMKEKYLEKCENSLDQSGYKLKDEYIVNDWNGEWGCNNTTINIFSEYNNDISRYLALYDILFVYASANVYLHKIDFEERLINLLEENKYQDLYSFITKYLRRHGVSDKISKILKMKKIELYLKKSDNLISVITEDTRAVLKKIDELISIVSEEDPEIRFQYDNAYCTEDRTGTIYLTCSEQLVNLILEEFKDLISINPNDENIYHLDLKSTIGKQIQRI